MGKCSFFIMRPHNPKHIKRSAVYMKNGKRGFLRSGDGVKHLSVFGNKLIAEHHIIQLLNGNVKRVFTSESSNFKSVLQYVLTWQWTLVFMGNCFVKKSKHICIDRGGRMGNTIHFKRKQQQVAGKKNFSLLQWKKNK